MCSSFMTSARALHSSSFFSALPLLSSLQAPAAPHVPAQLFFTLFPHLPKGLVPTSGHKSPHGEGSKCPPSVLLPLSCLHLKQSSPSSACLESRFMRPSCFRGQLPHTRSQLGMIHVKDFCSASQHHAFDYSFKSHSRSSPLIALQLMDL